MHATYPAHLILQHQLLGWLWMKIRKGSRTEGLQSTVRYYNILTSYLERMRTTERRTHSWWTTLRSRFEPGIFAIWKRSPNTSPRRSLRACVNSLSSVMEWPQLGPLNRAKSAQPVALLTRIPGGRALLSAGTPTSHFFIVFLSSSVKCRGKYHK
jgi:hypothetical protein